MSAIVVNHQTIKQVVDWLMPATLFAGIKARRNASWKPRMLAVAALLWATSDLSNLKDRFGAARHIVNKIFRWQPPSGATYQGFMKMLRKWHVHLQRTITAHVRAQMKEVLPKQWEVAGYVLFAGDGSRIGVPRTAAMEAAFSPRRKKKSKPKRKGKGKRSRGRGKTSGKAKAVKKQSAESIAKKGNLPQIWLTLLWHVGTGLPWAWRSGAANSSERDHLQQMLAELPENSLITADAGFVGYDFWSMNLDAGCHFVIRVGSNVRLLKQLGYARQHDHTVYLWPDTAAKKQQPPLVLRLIVIHNGKQPVYLVTNLTKSQLSDPRAALVYQARWGIELFFRTFKQTFGCRKLRSRSPENGLLELDWLLMGLWCICLLGQRELAQSGKDPARLSAATAIKAFQQTQRDYRIRPDDLAEHLWAKLRTAVLDDYKRTRPKTSRNYPRKKKRPIIGAPKITPASKLQINAAKALKQKQHELRFTA